MGAVVRLPQSLGHLSHMRVVAVVEVTIMLLLALEALGAVVMGVHLQMPLGLLELLTQVAVAVVAEMILLPQTAAQAAPAS